MLDFNAVAVKIKYDQSNIQYFRYSFKKNILTKIKNEQCNPILRK